MKNLRFGAVFRWALSAVYGMIASKRRADRPRIKNIKVKEMAMSKKAIEKMDAVEIREELKGYINDVEPNNAGVQLKETLTADIDGGVTHESQAIKTFLTNEKIIANETGDNSIVAMLERLIEIDRQAA